MPERVVQLKPENGRVIAKQANFCMVQLDTEERVLCTKRARLKKVGQQVWVGDRVRVEDVDLTANQGVITEVFPRTTVFERPPVANASQILLIFAIAEPELDPWQLSRFLLCAEATSMQTIIGLNKCDLVSTSTQQIWLQRLTDWGYPPILLSVEQNQGYAALYPALGQHITLLAGPSGVGKSSLIRALIPDVEVRISAVSGKLQRGRHTTRHVELYELPEQGWLVDSPGFNKPDLDCTPSELAAYFPEIRQRLHHQHCQFKDCIHNDEPGCVVQGDWERYEHYQRFLGEVQLQDGARQNRPQAESNFKLKIRAAGAEDYEPRLASKKYRRRSRRRQHQSLEQWQQMDEFLELDD